MSRWRSISGFDWVVLSGAAVNVIVVAALVGYWLLHR